MSRCTPHNDVDASALTDLFINATYFVDSNFGNDATGFPQDAARPYQTLGAVQALVTPGQVVFVHPGTYAEPTLNLSGATWYFSAGATTTTLITGTGQVFGSGNFIGQSPIVNHTSNQPIFIQANNFTTASDYAIVVNGTGFGQFFIENITSQHGLNVVAANTQTRFVVSGFIGSGTFLNLSAGATGSICCSFRGIECGAALVSNANDFAVNMSGNCVMGFGDYIVEIYDNSGAASNNVKINLGLRRTVCSGILRAIGLVAIPEPLLQPNINFDIQNIQSTNSSANSIVYIDHAFCCIKSNRFAFQYNVAGAYVVDILDESVFHMNCEQIYNNDFLFPDVRLIRITANSFSSARLIFNECYMTSQLVHCNGAGSSLSLLVLNLLAQNPTANSTIVNTGGTCVIDLKSGQFYHAQSIVSIQNSGQLHFSASALIFDIENGTFIENSGNMIVRAGFIQTSSSGSTVFNNNGGLGLVLGSIKMDGQNNTAINTRGLAILNIGQILSNASGNMGILVEDPGQLYGRVGRVVMQDMSCLETRTNNRVVLSFDEMVNGANAYVIYIEGSSEVVLTGGLIHSDNTRYLIYITGANAKFDINLVKLSVAQCDAAVFVSAVNSDVNLTLQHFEVTQNLVTAAIYAEAGNVTIKGSKFDIAPFDSVPVFVATGNVNMYIDVNFVEATHMLLLSDTSGNIWYSTSSSTTSGFQNCMDITPAGGNLTISGYFRGIAGHVVRFLGPNPLNLFRVLNCTLVSAGPNLISSGPVVNFICNHGIGNNAPFGLTSIPAGVFVVDAAVQ